MTRTNELDTTQQKAKLLSSIAKEILERRQELHRIETTLAEPRLSRPSLEQRSLRVEAATQRRALFRAFGELGRLGESRSSTRSPI